MASRGATTFQKRQKEMQRKERQQEKFAKRMERKNKSDVEPTADGGENPDVERDTDAGDPLDVVS